MKFIGEGFRRARLEEQILTDKKSVGIHLIRSICVHFCVTHMIPENHDRTLYGKHP